MEAKVRAILALTLMSIALNAVMKTHVLNVTMVAIQAMAVFLHL